MLSVVSLPKRQPTFRTATRSHGPLHVAVHVHDFPNVNHEPCVSAPAWHLSVSGKLQRKTIKHENIMIKQHLFKPLFLNAEARARSTNANPEGPMEGTLTPEPSPNYKTQPVTRNTHIMGICFRGVQGLGWPHVRAKEGLRKDSQKKPMKSPEAKWIGILNLLHPPRSCKPNRTDNNSKTVCHLEAPPFPRSFLDVRRKKLRKTTLSTHGPT